MLEFSVTSSLKCNFCTKTNCPERQIVLNELGTFMLSYFTPQPSLRDVDTHTIKFIYEHLFYYVSDSFVRQALPIYGFTVAADGCLNISKRDINRIYSVFYHNGYSLSHYWRKDEASAMHENRINYIIHSERLRRAIHCYTHCKPGNSSLYYFKHKPACDNTPHLLNRDHWNSWSELIEKGGQFCCIHEYKERSALGLYTR